MVRWHKVWQVKLVDPLIQWCSSRKQHGHNNSKIISVETKKLKIKIVILITTFHSKTIKMWISSNKMPKRINSLLHRSLLVQLKPQIRRRKSRPSNKTSLWKMQRWSGKFSLKYQEKPSLSVKEVSSQSMTDMSCKGVLVVEPMETFTLPLTRREMAKKLPLSEFTTPLWMWLMRRGS